MLPTERTTPEQLEIVWWGFIVVLVLVGVLGLWYGLQAPPEMAEPARRVILRSGFAIATAGLIYGCKRFVQAWLD